MANSDTIRLLQECDAGTKMAVNSIDEILEKVENNTLKQLLQKSKEHHKQLEQDIHVQLKQYGGEENLLPRKYDVFIKKLYPKYSLVIPAGFKPATF